MHRGGPGRGGMTTVKPKDLKKSFGKLFSYMKQYKVHIIIAIVFAMFGAFFGIIGPSQIGKITNMIQEAATNTKLNGVPFELDFDAIWKIVATLIVVYLLSFLFSVIQGLIMSNVTQKAAKKLRTDVAAKINKLPLKYLDQRNYGDILSIAANDIDTIGQAINNTIIDIIRALTTLIGVSVYMLTISWQMALVSFIFAPLNFLIIQIVMKRSQKYFRSNQSNLGRVNAYIEESYTGHDILTVFNASEERKQKFLQYNNELKETSWKSQFFSGMMQPIMSFIGNVSYVVVALVGAGFSGAMIGDIQSMLIYNRRFTQPFSQIAQSLTMVQSALAASERVFDFLDASNMSSELGFETRKRDIVGNVEFKNVKFGYVEDKEIIHDFSLSVKAGQKIAIVGPTGAGKTTLVNLLMKFYEVNSGDILIDGLSINEMTRSDVHDCFGMVLQDTWLFRGTIKENLVFNQDDVSKETLKEIAQSANINHFIESLPKGYNTLIEDADSVSQGQRQLFTIARAMIKNAPILILDEATSNVDTRTELLIQNAMDELMKGRTSFVIAHRLSTIKNADIILVLNEGDIVESGNHKELMEKEGFYASLYNSQFEL